MLKSFPPMMNPMPGDINWMMMKTPKYSGKDFGSTFSSKYALNNEKKGALPAPMINMPRIKTVK
jgi:hypothetical protein